MATDHFLGIPKRRLVTQGDFGKAGITHGTSDTAANFFSFRWQSNDGSAATGVTKEDCIVALEAIGRYIMENGLVGDGADVPPA